MHVLLAIAAILVATWAALDLHDELGTDGTTRRRKIRVQIQLRVLRNLDGAIYGAANRAQSGVQEASRVLRKPYSYRLPS